MGEGRRRQRGATEMRPGDEGNSWEEECLGSERKLGVANVKWHPECTSRLDPPHFQPPPEPCCLLHGDHPTRLRAAVRRA